MLPYICETDKPKVPYGMILMENGRMCIDQNASWYHRLDRVKENLRKDLESLVEKNGDDIDIIIKAYEKADSLHGRTLRKSCDSLYIIHPLSVAYSLASLGVEADIIAAALLHDTVEDCGYTTEAMTKEFNSPIPEIVEAVTKVTKEKMPFINELPEYIVRQKQTELTQDKLYDTDYWYESLLVKLADREHNLSTISALSAEKQRIMAQNTRSFLIAPAQKLGIRYYVITLEDYCLKILEPDLYYQIKSQRDEILRKNGPKISLFVKSLLKTLEDTPFQLSSHQPLLQNQMSLNQSKTYRILLSSEIYKQMLNKHLNGYFWKQDIYLAEVILTYSPNLMGNPFSVFFDLYYDKLFPQGIFLQYFNQDVNDLNDLGYHFILTDSQENHYSIWLVPQNQIKAFYLGSLLNTAKSRLHKNKRFSNKMIVYSYNQKTRKKREHQVPSKITALDLAFEFQPDLAKCVTGCYIRRDINFSSDDKVLPPGTFLNEGDIVSYIADYDGPSQFHYHISIDSFLAVTTVRAKAALVSHFRKQIESSCPSAQSE